MEIDKDKLLETLKAEYLTISYYGPFDGKVLSTFAKTMEERLQNENGTVAKKIFKIFIELAQNISLYSTERVVSKEEENFTGYGLFILKEFNDYFWLLTGNKATNNDAFLAAEKCKTINSFSREQLREYKRMLRKRPVNEKGGGNIGLIQVALLSNNKLQYQITKLDENNAFLTIGVEVPKKN